MRLHRYIGFIKEAANKSWSVHSTEELRGELEHLLDSGLYAMLRYYMDKGAITGVRVTKHTEKGYDPLHIIYITIFMSDGEDMDVSLMDEDQGYRLSNERFKSLGSKLYAILKEKDPAATPLGLDMDTIKSLPEYQEMMDLGFKDVSTMEDSKSGSVMLINDDLKIPIINGVRYEGPYTIEASYNGRVTAYINVGNSTGFETQGDPTLPDEERYARMFSYIIDKTKKFDPEKGW